MSGDDLRARAATALARSLANAKGSTRLIDGSRSRRVARAIDALPNITRQVLVAHRAKGLGYREIAADLGLAVADVERHMAEAIAAIDRAAREGADEVGADRGAG